MEHVYFEIKNSAIEKQLIAGVVLTGGGAQLRHLRQLVEYMTGMPSRIGYPNEHLAKSDVEQVTSPLFATGVGLVMKGLDHLEKRRPQQKENKDRVKGHSQGSRMGSFFDKVLNKASEILNEDDV